MTIILQTKIIPPPLRETFVARPRLCAGLDQVLQRRLALVCAPAGYGKTSLLRHWIERLPLKDGEAPGVAWLSLDESDDDLHRFLSAVVAALQRQNPALGRSAEAILAQAQRAAPGAAVTALLNDLQGVGATLVLVLDDLHLLQDEQVHEALRLLANGLPPNAHLVIGSRADPPLPLGRLRVRGELLELRAADLRFTPQESATFFNEVMGLHLPAQSVAQLDQQCEGWIAALQMAALNMASPPPAKLPLATQTGEPASPAHQRDVTAFVETFGHGHAHLFDYLAEEVLDRQPQHVRRFLLQTSILDSLCGPLCDALHRSDEQTANGSARESQRLLQELVAANLFLAPLDNEERWFRYHPLFQTFLRRQLALQDGDEAALHRRAGAWYAQNGLYEAAVRHALAAGDPDQAADRVGHAIRDLFKEGKLLEIRRYLEMLPEEAILARHNFCAGYAWVLALGGELQRVEKYLQAAESHLAQLGHEPPPPFDIDAQRSNLSLVRASVAQRRGDAAAMDHIARQALETLDQGGAPALRSIAAYTLAQACLMRGQVQEAQQALQQAVAYGETAGHHYLAGSALNALADVRCRQGRLQAAEALYRRVAEVATGARGVRKPALLGSSTLGLASLALQRNQRPQAADLAADAVDYAQAGGEVASLVQAYTLLARVQRAQGQEEDAELALHEALSLAQRWQLPAATARVIAWRARFALWAQNGVAAMALARQAARVLQEAEGDGAPYGAARELVDLALARAHLMPSHRDCQVEATDLELAGGIVNRWQRFARRTGLSALSAETLLLQARIKQLQNQSEAACRSLAEAVLLAQPEGLMRPFLDEGPWLAPLLRDLAQEEGVAPFARDLLQAIEQEWPAAPPFTAAEPLTARQQEVLEMMARGLSNREIAEQLVISVETVRWHTKQIYRRLDVRNRTEAAAYARRRFSPSS